MLLLYSVECQHADAVSDPCEMRSAQVSSLTNVIESTLNCVIYLNSVANYASSWHVATAEVGSAYKAFSVERIMGKVGVYIGLDHANITLDAMPLYYNEVMNFHAAVSFEFPWLHCGMTLRLWMLYPNLLFPLVNGRAL